MFSYAFNTGISLFLSISHPCLIPSTASTYFHLPIDEEEDKDIENYERKYLTWVAEPSLPTNVPSSSQSQSCSDPSLSEGERLEILKSVLSNNCLYNILGVPKNSIPDKMTLRRAYLARSRACHPECVLSIYHTPICYISEQ